MKSTDTRNPSACRVPTWPRRLLCWSAIVMFGVAVIGLFVCGWGIFGGFTPPARADIAVSEDSLVTLPLSWIVGFVGFLMVAVVVPVASHPKPVRSGI